MEPSDRNINELLTDDCLRLIFRKCRICHLLHIRAVCSRWQTVIEQQIFPAQHSLKLFGSFSALHSYHHGMVNVKVKEIPDFPELYTITDELVVSTDPVLAAFACQIIPEIFPNVTILLMACPQMFKTTELSDHLLVSYAPSMKTFIVNGMPQDIVIPHNFWLTLASMSQLEKLFLIRLYKICIPMELMAPVMSKLKHVGIAFYENNISPIITSLGPCISLKLSYVTLSTFLLEQMIDSNQEFVKTVKRLTLGMISPPKNEKIGRIENFKQILNLLCNRFVHCNELDMLLADQLDLIDLIPILAQLPKLLDIWLYIGRHQLHPNWDKLYALPQLRTVRTLYLEIYDLEIPTFKHWVCSLFPNVEDLTIKFDYEEDMIPEFKDFLLKEFKRLKKYDLRSIGEH